MTVLRVRPTDAVLGANVDGVDLRALDADTFAAIHRAWLDHQVLLFGTAADRRGSRRLQPPPGRSRPGAGAGDRPTLRRRHPEIYIVSNVVQDGVPIGSLGSGEAVWHTDMSYLADPPKASILYALEVPPRGGDTSFCSMYAAWDRLPDPLQRRVERLRSNTTAPTTAAATRAGRAPTDDPRRSPGTFHPLVSVHPETGRRTSISAGAAWRASKACRSTSRKRCSTRCGRRREPLAWRTSGGRRSGAVGQPLHDAPPRRVRSGTRRILHRTQIKADRQPSRPLTKNRA